VLIGLVLHGGEDILLARTPGNVAGIGIVVKEPRQDNNHDDIRGTGPDALTGRRSIAGDDHRRGGPDVTEWRTLHRVSERGARSSCSRRQRADRDTHRPSGSVRSRRDLNVAGGSGRKGSTRVEATMSIEPSAG
jgi:hypothetical protein